jgi:hypothetical protein
LLVKWRIDDAVDAIPVHVSLCLCWRVHGWADYAARSENYLYVLDIGWIIV